MVGKRGLWGLHDEFKGASDKLHIFNDPQWASAGAKITFMLSTFERLYPAHKIRHWIKRESVPPFGTPGWHLKMRMNLGGDGSSPLPCLWMPAEAEALSANSSLWKNRRQSQPPGSINGEMALQHTQEKMTLCSSWQQSSCSSTGRGRGARACRSPGLQSGASGLFG